MKRCTNCGFYKIEYIGRATIDKDTGEEIQMPATVSVWLSLVAGCVVWFIIEAIFTFTYLKINTTPDGRILPNPPYGIFSLLISTIVAVGVVWGIEKRKNSIEQEVRKKIAQKNKQNISRYSCTHCGYRWSENIS